MVEDRQNHLPALLCMLITLHCGCPTFLLMICQSRRHFSVTYAQALLTAFHRIDMITFNILFLPPKWNPTSSTKSSGDITRLPYVIRYRRSSDCSHLPPVLLIGGVCPQVNSGLASAAASIRQNFLMLHKMHSGSQTTVFGVSSYALGSG